MSKRKREAIERLKKREEYGIGKDVYLPFSEEHLNEYQDVEWICSHLQPNKILWSSDTTKVKPNIDISVFTNHEQNNVVNTWFVQSPTTSGNGTSLNKWTESLDRAAALLKQATAILIVAGAGIGVDSGLPDYRGPEGFWKAYPRLKDRGLSLEDMSHPDWFTTDPIAAWGFYGHRASLYHSAVPHKGFDILREIVSIKKDNYFIFTSNIDSQFQKAGFDPEKIYECHGSLSYLQCTNANCDEVWPVKNEIPKVSEDLRAISPIPRCSLCGVNARPNSSMFGDTNHTWKDTRANRQKKAFLAWLHRNYGDLDTGSKNQSHKLRKLSKKGCGASSEKLVILEIGCGISLHSLRMEVEMLLMDNKTRVVQDGRGEVGCIRLNPTEYWIGDGHIGIGLGAMEALVEIDNRLKGSEDKNCEEENKEQH